MPENFKQKQGTKIGFDASKILLQNRAKTNNFSSYFDSLFSHFDSLFGSVHLLDGGFHDGDAGVYFGEEVRGPGVGIVSGGGGERGCAGGGGRG